LIRVVDDGGEAGGVVFGHEGHGEVVDDVLHGSVFGVEEEADSLVSGELADLVETREEGGWESTVVFETGTSGCASTGISVSKDSS